MEIGMPEGTHLAYTTYHEARWWGQVDLGHRPNGGRRCVQIAASSDRDGGCKWEFGVVEYLTGRRPALRLGIFDEGWEAFTCMRPFFDALADGSVKTLADLVGLLDELGATDETDR